MPNEETYGYHTYDIPKGVFGEVSKIKEVANKLLLSISEKVNGT